MDADCLASKALLFSGEWQHGSWTLLDEQLLAPTQQGGRVGKVELKLSSHRLATFNCCCRLWQQEWLSMLILEKLQLQSEHKAEQVWPCFILSQSGR